jgi:hypothetical protein
VKQEITRSKQEVKEESEQNRILEAVLDDIG